MTDEIVLELGSVSPPELKVNGSPPPEKLKCLLAFCVTVFGTSFASAMIVLNNDRVPMSEAPLPDLIFDVFPRTPYAFQLAECILLFMLFVMLCITFLHHHRYSRF